MQRKHFVATLLLFAATSAGQESRAAVPDPTAQKEILARLSDAYRAELAQKSPKDRIALLRKWQDSLASVKDEREAFVMLLEMHALAVEVGEDEAAFDALDRLEGRF